MKDNKLWNKALTSLCVGMLSLIMIGVSAPSFVNNKSLDDFINTFVTKANNTNKIILTNDCGITIAQKESDLKYNQTTSQLGCGIQNVLPYYYTIINNYVPSLSFLENTTTYNADTIKQQVLENLNTFSKDDWEQVIGALIKYPLTVEIVLDDYQHYRYVENFEQIPETYSTTSLTTITPMFSSSDWYSISWTNNNFYPTNVPMIIGLVILCVCILVFVICVIISRKENKSNTETKE